VSPSDQGDDMTTVGAVVTDADTARRAIALIDLTDLGDDSTAERVAALCDRAVAHGTAAVCVWPDFVARAAEALASTPVRVATVVNFPSGDERPFAVGVLTDRALGDGADEIDVVLPYRAFVAGDHARAAGVLDTVRAAAGDAVVKVILETGALAGDDSIERAARFAIDHGADFVKTSTGKIPVSATPEAAAVMLAVIASSGRRVGIKPSGGIGTLAAAAQYLELAESVMGPDWVGPDTFRFGASGLLDALLSVVDPDAAAGDSTSTY
jgi:deoxyribose-phosphate aldolase